MRFSPKSIVKLLIICFVTIGMVGTVTNNIHAKRYHYHTYRYVKHPRYHRGRRHKRRYRHDKAVYLKRHKRKHYHRNRRLKRYKRRTRAILRQKRYRENLHEQNSSVEFHEPDSSMGDVTQMEYETIKMINIDRAAYNLPPLRRTKGLTQLARKRADQLVELNYLTHKDPQGRNYYEVDAKRMGIHLGAYSGENIAGAGLGPILMDSNPHIYNNDNGIQMANMDEDEMFSHDGDSHWGHRDNILNSHYTKIGVGAELKEGDRKSVV